MSADQRSCLRPGRTTDAVRGAPQTQFGAHHRRSSGRTTDVVRGAPQAQFGAHHKRRLGWPLLAAREQEQDLLELTHHVTQMSRFLKLKFARQLNHALL